MGFRPCQVNLLDPPCQCTTATCKKTFQENYFDACNMMEQVKDNTKLIISTYTKYTVHLRSFEHSVATNKCHIESYRSLYRQQFYIIFKISYIIYIYVCVCVLLQTTPLDLARCCAAPKAAGIVWSISS